MKITGPRESVLYFKQDLTKISGSYQTLVQGATGPVAQIKYWGPQATVPGSYKTALLGATQNGVVAQDLTKISGSYQTSLLGATESGSQMKITGPKESVAYFKQDSPQTALWGATESSSQMKITGPNESVAYSKQDFHQTSPPAAIDSFNFG
jgi:hypothetical protein